MGTQEVRRRRTVTVHLCPACGRSHKNVDANLINKVYWASNSPSYAIRCPLTCKHFKVEVNRGFSLVDDEDIESDMNTDELGAAS